MLDLLKLLVQDEDNIQNGNILPQEVVLFDVERQLRESES